MPVLRQRVDMRNPNSADAHFQAAVRERRPIAHRIWQRAGVFVHKKLLGYARQDAIREHYCAKRDLRKGQGRNLHVLHCQLAFPTIR